MLVRDLRSEPSLHRLQDVILLKPPQDQRYSKFSIFEDVISKGAALQNDRVRVAQEKVNMHDVCNLQFTSGTTGLPKASMLSHQ